LGETAAGTAAPCRSRNGFPRRNSKAASRPPEHKAAQGRSMTIVSAIRADLTPSRGGRTRKYAIALGRPRIEPRVASFSDCHGPMTRGPVTRHSLQSDPRWDFLVPASVLFGSKTAWWPDVTQPTSGNLEWRGSPLPRHSASLCNIPNHQTSARLAPPLLGRTQAIKPRPVVDRSPPSP